ncbi:single-stranded-DNA-specific exonuclease RecJ [Parahaliea aestuarii]|uniref:Single-stranded-DNA-specific exonuclease RecJ n=1 Tax=Parahaliea aestuarii TaxID=1852021 RepID=A0A5C8ZW59_9GAMM|nr:single-stranded-DNA-specific exonuclease RecJ [Parahaliea aestuarii]
MRRRAPGGSLDAPGLHPLLARVYGHRGVASAGELELGLNRLLPPPSMLGAEAAAELLADAIAGQKRLLIVGDFDADGATSTALAVSTLRRFGAVSVDYLVPNRFDYGYGLTPEIVELAAQRNPDLIITVDNGISSIEGVAAARALGIDTLVTDHHLAGRELPAAAVIVNPNQPGCSFPSKALAGVGVIFYVMLALRAELRRRDWFTRQGTGEPNMAEVLDLVALGTVADVVPLDHNNRILVDAGLKRIRAGQARPGILALLEVASRRFHNVVASDLGFAAGPRLNAAGRLDDMSVGIECLLSEDAGKARRIAAELHQLNQDRRTIERGMERQALQMLAGLDLEAGGEPPLAMTLFDPDWHQGVIGILASRVKDRLHRPTIAFANADESGMEIKGSARSIQGIHIRDVLDAVATRHPGLITKFGGHAMAAGLSLPRSRYEDFSRAFVEEVARHADAVDLQAIVESDGELDAADFDLEAATALRYAGPWGQHFPEPLFDGRFQVVSQRIVGERHLKLVLGLPGTNTVVDAIAFNVDTELWPDASVTEIEAAYRLDVNEFRGQHSVQLVIEFLRSLP